MTHLKLVWDSEICFLIAISQITKSLSREKWLKHVAKELVEKILTLFWSGGGGGEGEGAKKFSLTLPFVI